MTKREAKDLGWRCLTLYLPLILFLIGTLFPFYWIVNTSLKDSVEVLSLPIKYWPDNPTLSNYFYLFEKMGFGNNVANTAFVATLMIPLFQTMVKLHLINSLWSLVLICTCTNLPFCMFMMMGYYSSVPRELEEAAQVDGCTLLGAVFRVLIPVMLPSIVATGAYAFINAWNVYVYATAFITDKAKYTLPLALNVFQGEYGTDYGKLAAGCVIALIPVVVIFAFIQKHLSGGATSGAVKG